MKSIYIVLSYTGSYPSKLIKLFTGSKYAHISISFDRDLNKMYSFGRKYLHFPVPGAFVEESLSSGLFIKDKVLLKVVEVKITKEQYESLKRYISLVQGSKPFYDYKGAVGTYLGKNMFKENGYTCASFIAKSLSSSLDIHIDYWSIIPEEIEEIIDGNIIFEGLAKNYLK